MIPFQLTLYFDASNIPFKVSLSLQFVTLVMIILRYIIETHHQTAKEHIAEVTVQYKGGAVVHVSESTEDMYSSIDIVAHKLARSLKKRNEKMRDKRRHQKVPDEEQIEWLNDVVEADFEVDGLIEGLDPKYRGKLINDVSSAPLSSGVRPKKFPMPPISVEEAVGALEFIDHPFYVFRNKVC